MQQPLTHLLIYLLTYRHRQRDRHKDRHTVDSDIATLTHLLALADRQTGRDSQ